MIRSLRCGLLVVATAAACAAANLNLCGVADNGAGDANGAPGIVSGVCIFGAGAGGFAGSAREVSGGNFYKIIITGIFTGVSGEVILATGDYSLLGEGRELAIVNGTLDNQPGVFGPSVGGEFFRAGTFGSSFNNNLAVAQANGPAAGSILPAAMQAYNERNGEFSGDGVAEAHGAWDAGFLQQIEFPASAEYVYAVPEPTTALFFGLGAAVLWIRKSRMPRAHTREIATIQ
jgi:hypothetical protein